MAERKTGPVKPPTIDLTAREAGAETEKTRRSAPRKPAAETIEPAETIADEDVVTAADADGMPEPQPIPPVPPTPPEPPRLSGASSVVQPPLPWGMLGTAAVAGALLGTALTYVLATMVPLPAPPVPNLAPELSAQADRITTIEDRLGAVETGTLDVRSALDDTATDLAAKVAALESGIDGVRGAIPTPTDTSAIEERLRTLASRVDAIAAGASSADAGAIAENIGDLEQSVAALEAEVAALKTAAEATPDEPPAPAPSASLPIVLSGLESAFATGRSFTPELTGLRAALPDITIDPLLESSAAGGLVRPDVLDRAFATAVPAMLAAKPAAGGGWEQQAGDWIASLLAMRPAGEIEGDSPDAIVSRIEAAMGRHDYTTASALFAALPPEMAAAANGVDRDIAAHAAGTALIDELRGRILTP